MQEYLDSLKTKQGILVLITFGVIGKMLVALLDPASLSWGARFVAFLIPAISDGVILFLIVLVISRIWSKRSLAQVMPSFALLYLASSLVGLAGVGAKRHSHKLVLQIESSMARQSRAKTGASSAQQKMAVSGPMPKPKAGTRDESHKQVTEVQITNDRVGPYRVGVALVSSGGGVPIAWDSLTEESRKSIAKSHGGGAGTEPVIQWKKARR